MENKLTKEQELDVVGQYVEYTLKNIDDFERRIRKERKKQMDEARVDFLKGLKGKLNEWWVWSDEEQKHMDSLIRAINEYVNYLNK